MDTPADVIESTNLDPQDFICYGVFLPLVNSLGIIGNFITFFVLMHPEMRSLSTMLLHGLLFSDITYLLCTIIVRSPTSWVMHAYAGATNSTDFWHHLDGTQRLFMAAYPVKEIGWCLVAWYSSAVLVEQLCVYVCPERLSTLSKPANATKITITLPIFALLIHLLTFFKYTRQPVSYHAVEHQEICLSQLYRDPTFQIYEQYIYIIIFIFLPSMCACLTVPKMLKAYKKNKRDPDVTQMSRSLDRVFKSGRSTHIVLGLAVAFFISQVVITAVYFGVADDLDVNPLSAKCHKLPVERAFEDQHPSFPRIHYFLSSLYAGLNFPLCFFCGKDFRHTLIRMLWNLKKKKNEPEDQPSKDIKLSHNIDSLFDHHRRRQEVRSWMREHPDPNATYI